MINLPTDDELNDLKSINESLCLTIYTPIIASNTTTNPNRIELKNLLRKAEAELLSAGATTLDVKKTLRPAKLLLEDTKFWASPSESLALFMHPEFYRCYHLPELTTPYILSVKKGFDLEPIEKILKENIPYFVLALGHKNVRIFEGDHHNISAVNLKNFPTDMKQALNIDEYPNWRETHNIAPASFGKGSEAFHGQYNVAQTDKAMLLEFFRRIDKRLRSFLQNKHTPVILAGVEYLMPIYRQANTYKYLLPSFIKGNTEHTSLVEIREQACSLISAKGTI